MRMSAPPADALILKRAETMERRARRALNLVVWLETGVVVVTALGAAFMLALAFSLDAAFAWAAAGFAVVAAVNAYSLRGHLRWRNAERQLRGLQVWIAPQGVTYTTTAGNFSAPWSAVRRVALAGRQGGLNRTAAALFVDADGWGGPLSVFGQVCSVRIPLEGAGIDPAVVANTVQRFSDGRITLSGGLLPGLQRRS
jgi:hypothetical protein